MRYLRLSIPFVASALLLMATSCDITTEPESAVTDANIFNDVQSYKAFLAKLYGGLVVTGQEGPHGQGDFSRLDEGFTQYTRQLWQLQELPTDEAVIAWNDAGLPELSNWGWASSNQFVEMVYSRIFFQISLINEFLRETTDDKLAARGHSELAETIHGYRAEARFLRALSYWHGIDLYGDIPLVDENFAIGSIPPTQSTRADIFQFIVSELTAIRNELPAPGMGEYARADQGAVAMLLAKVYMNAEVYVGSDMYSSAFNELDDVLGAYELASDYRANFMADNNNSPEIIFAVPQDGKRTRTWGGTTFLTHAGVGGTIMDPSEYGLNGGWWGLRVTPEFYGLFVGDTTTGWADGRAIFFWRGQNLEIGSITNWNDGYAAPKYTNMTSLGVPGSDLEMPDTDYPMFRLADAYLMYAEIVLRGGPGTRAEALTYVNELRERAYGNTSGNIADADLTLDFILDERARELWWEGHRRTDLIRFGKYTGGDKLWSWKGGTQAGTPTSDFLALYPIPSRDLLANPNLKQNPGY